MAAREGNKRRVSHEKAILALISSGSVSEAAREVGVTRRTMTIWLSDSEFQDRYAEARKELLQAGLAGLHGLLSAACRALKDALDDPQASHSAKLRAAEIVFDRAVKAHELFEIERRLTALEQAQVDRI